MKSSLKTEVFPLDLKHIYLKLFEKQTLKYSEHKQKIKLMYNLLSIIKT